MEKASLSVYIATLLFAAVLYSCSNAGAGSSGEFTGAEGEVKLMTVDPGHFHAALVQKDMYEQVDPEVYVYAPEGDDLQLHLQRIEQYNTREDNPTNWIEEVYAGPDFFQQMIDEKPGNVVVLSGNNAKKTQYIKQSVDAGLNVLADKPMVIKPDNFPMLRQALETAEDKGLLVYDIMTERYEITTILQKELSQFENVFGTLEKGTPDKPAITKESVHHFFKYVSGQPLIRPAWFFDVDQQGEGIADVSTHLVDLILWESFPGQGIDTTEVEVVNASRWPTEMTPSQFKRVTGMETYPDYLIGNVKEDSVLNVYSNGAFVFNVRGIYGKVSVTWDYQAPEGGGDTHYSIMRGTKANLVIRQDKEQNYIPTLYVEPLNQEDREQMESDLQSAIEKIGEQYPDVSVKPSSDGWQVVIPNEHRVGHEAHFAQVTEKYLQHLIDGKLPDWEEKNMLTKYFLTTEAYKMSR